VDLADALSLLLDVETAAPELLATALDRLHLSENRRSALAPLLEERIRGHQVPGADQRNDAALTERTQQLIRVANGDAAFDGFAAFDLCIDEATEQIITGTGEAIAATNLADAQLTCMSQLLTINASPDVAERLLRQVTRLLGELEQTNSWGELGSRLAALHRNFVSFRESRPEVSAAIAAALDAFYTPARFGRLLSMYEAGGESRDTANLMLSASGQHIMPAILRGLQDANNKPVLQLVCDHAATFAPVLVTVLDQLPLPQRVLAIRALGATGRGVELQLAKQLTQPQEVLVRETLQALARIGSDEAAECVTRYLLRLGTAAPLAAEEALWHFKPAATHNALRSLLRQREFVTANPEMTLRLFERTDRFDPSKLADVIRPLTSLRFRFWNRRLMRIGQRATTLLK